MLEKGKFLAMPRKPYSTDVSNEEWDFARPYLALITTEAPQRQHDLREVFNAVRWLLCAGSPGWRMLPNDLPPWEAVYQQTRRWLQAGCFEAMASDLRSIIRVAQGKQGKTAKLAWADQGYTGQQAHNDTRAHGVQLKWSSC